MKKILKISLMIILLLCVSINCSYATIDFSLNLSASKSTELKKNDEITVAVKISNVKSSLGLVTFGATLEYPETNLELVDIQGNGKYPKPSYSAKTKKLLIEREPSKDEGTMFTLKFKVKNEDNKNMIVALNNITASDGSGLFKMNSKSVTLKIQEQTQKPSNPGSTATPSKPGNTGTTKPGSSTTTKPSGTQKPGNTTNKPSTTTKPGSSTSNKKPSSTSNSGSSTSNKKQNKSQNSSSSTSNKKDTTLKKSNLPYTGIVKKVIPISILMILAVSIILYIKMRQIDKK